VNRGLRYRADTGFELKCNDCREWWPLDTEFYDPIHGLQACKACHLERRRNRETGRYKRVEFMTPEQRKRKRVLDNARKKREREDPNRGDKLRARERKSQADYYERHLDSLRARRRAQYEAAVGHPPTPGIGRPREDRAA
jgi:hypothetical protein